MAKILVTGATGFVGRTLIPSLIASGHDVRCAVSRQIDIPHTEQILIPRLEDPIDWSLALKGIDIVIHLAARAHIMREPSKSPLDEYCKVNSIATENLAKEAVKQGVKRFIFLSSIKVNGESTTKQPAFVEGHTPNPEDPYAVSKWLAEQSLRAIAHQSSMDVVILRPPLIYGEGVKANFLNLMKWAKKGIPLPFKGVDNKRSFVYIDNLISAIGALIDAPQAANQLYLVADDEALSLSDLLLTLGRSMDVNIKLIPLPVSLLSLMLRSLGLNKLRTRLLGSLEVNNSKIKTELGWSPPFSALEGLAKTVAWYKNESNI